MMETEGPPPVAFPPQNVRDKQPKREQEKAKPSSRGTKKASLQKDAASPEEEAKGKTEQKQAEEVEEPNAQESRVDIRI